MKWAALWMTGLALGCSSHGAVTSGDSSAGVAGEAETPSIAGTAGNAHGGIANGGNAHGGDATGGNANGGNANGSGDAGQAGEAGGGAAGNDVQFVPLPSGSRALTDVVNLVDAQAAAQLDAFITTDSDVPVFEQHGLDVSLNLFLEHYEEVYDFVFFLTDHPLPQTDYIGKFEPVTRPPLRGTGSNIGIVADNYKTNGRVKGVIGIQYLTGQFGPFSHEILHYWADYLDPQFGFDNPHWGFAGVHGQLGGFDAATLACETPKGAEPPGCTGLGNGLTAYSVGVFAPNANGPSIPYAPLELYLMGLLPVAEVPPQIELLSAASVRSNSYNAATGTEIVEATALKSIAVSDIVARHGQVPLLSNDQRAFRAAFVVLSAAPVSDALLSELSNWSAALGNRVANPDFKSFEFVTGGRATLDTRLGPRRDANAPPPTVRAPFKCDLTHENCAPAGAGLSCYANGQQTFCAIPGTAKRGEPCTQNVDCIAQHECRYGMASPKPVCEPRCDSLDNSAANSCNNLCPNNYILLGTPDGQLLAADCKAP